MKKMIILLSVVFCLVLSGCGNVDSGSSSGLKYHVKCADAVDVELSLSSNTDYSLFVQDGGDRFYVYRSKAEVPTVQDGSLDTSSDIDVTKVGNDYKIELGESLLNMRDLYGNYSLSICYTGTLNDDAVSGKQGNINTARYTLHTNTGESFTSSDSSADTYTFGMTVRKFDTGGSAVEGAEFAVYGSDADARSGHNPLGTGRTDTDGLCVFVKPDGTKAHFRNGTYYN